MATQIIDPVNAWVEPVKQDGMSDEELSQLLREQERASVGFRDSALAGEQAAALSFYEAEPFGDEIKGRSKVVVPDVAEVVDYMQISVLRTVASADRVVEFEPGDTDQMPELPDEPDPQDQQAMQAFEQARAQLSKWEEQRAKAADDATAAVNHIFMRRQNGYRILLDWLQSGLIEKVGIIKTACVTQRKKIRETGVVSSQEELAVLYSQSPEGSVDVEQNQDGTFQVTMSRYQEVKRYIDYPIPSEEYIFAPRTRDEDDCDYQAHMCRKTLSDLIEMGFDRDVVEGLPTDDGVDDFRDQRGWARWHDQDQQAYQRGPSMRQVVLLEEYARLDLDGDGVAELWQIFRVGDVILEKNEVEEAPFVVWSPFPRAHRLVGNSLAEKTMDIQRVDSVLLRQALDGVYLTNRPRVWLPAEATNENTIDDLLNPNVGVIIRGQGAIPPQTLNDAFDISKSLGMLEYMQGQRETRTGITRLNQGLDEDTINKTASGQAQLQAQGQQMEEFVARNFAEGMARLFAKKLRLMKAHGEPIAIKVEGNYRRVDPSTWDGDMNIAVRVGLGSGRKEQRILYRMQVGQQQAEALENGLPIVSPKLIYNNAAGFVRDAGLGNPDDFWMDPDSPEAQQAQAAKPQQPDPAMAKVQQDGQIAQAKMQAQQQSDAAKMQLDQQKAAAELEHTQAESAAKIELMRAEAEAKLQLEREKAEYEAQANNAKAEREWQMAQEQFAHQIQMDRMKAQHAHEQGMEKAKMSANRPGGELDK